MADLYLSNLKLFNLGISPGGRLTLTTGIPVTTSDVTGATTIYYTPYIHNIIELWNGKKWLQTNFTETSLAVGTVVKNAIYDIFGYLSSGTLTLEKLIWKNNTFTVTIASPGVVTWTAHGLDNGDGISFTTSGALPTGLVADTVYYVINKTTDTFQVTANWGGTAINTSGSQSGTHTAYCLTKRGTDVTYQDGRLCKSGDKTRILLGSFQATSTSATEDSNQYRYLSNLHNTVERRLRQYESTSTWTYSTATHRPLNNSTTNRVAVLCCIPKLVTVTLISQIFHNANALMISSIGVDSTNSPFGVETPLYAVHNPGTNSYRTVDSHVITNILGSHFYQGLEYCDGATGTWGAGSHRGFMGFVRN